MSDRPPGDPRAGLNVELTATNDATKHGTERPTPPSLQRTKKRRWFRGYHLLLALFAVQAVVFVSLQLRSSPTKATKDAPFLGDRRGGEEEEGKTKDAPFLGDRRGGEEEEGKKQRKSKDGGERRRPSRREPEEVRGRGVGRAIAGRLPPRTRQPSSLPLTKLRRGADTGRKEGEVKKPEPRPRDLSSQKRASAVASLVPGGIADGASLKPCRVVFDDGEEGGDAPSGLCDPGGRKGGSFVASNPLNVPRTWCGVSVGPNAAIRLDANAFAKCEGGGDARTARLFDFVPKVPPVTEEDDKAPPPIVLNPHENSKTQTTSNGKKIECNVPCYVEKQQRGRSYTVGGTRWSITYSMEGPQYYHDLKIDPKGYKKHRYWATTSFRSDIPLPYFSWAEYNIKTPPVNFDDAIKGASFIARNCNSRNRRENVVKELRKHFRVDSLSSCLKNAKPPKGLTMTNKVKLMQQYLFYLSFENQSEDDYITEKLWGGMESGAIPVFYGASNVREHVPTPGSVIFVDDFPDEAALGAYLNKVANNRTLYDEHQAWRLAPDLPEPFKRKFDFTHIHSVCRMCRWSYAKKYGLGWDHLTQTVQERKIPREVCVEAGGLGALVRPFREHFMSSLDDEGDKADEKEAGSMACDKTGANERSVIVGGRSLRRRVSERDGVVDVFLLEEVGSAKAGKDEDEKPLVYRIRTDVRNKAGTCFARGRRETEFRKRTGKGGPASSLSEATIQRERLTALTIQDVKSRITILTDWETSMACPKSGIVDVLVRRPRPRGEEGSRFVERAIRVVVEDSDALHYDDETAFPSHYGNLVTKDFEHPLELWYVDGKKA